METEQVLDALGVDSSDGLDESEVVRRLDTVGPNVLVGRSRPTTWSLLLRQFSSVLVWVLVAAAVVGGLVLGDVIEAVAILAIVLINAGIGFTQERRAEDAMAALLRLSAPSARVMRGGNVADIPASSLVPGDLLVLEAGDRMSADARVLESVRLTVDESALTGESFPILKQPAPVGEGAVIGDQRSMVFAGTTVTTGRGMAVVVSTGAATQVGRIAGLLQEEEPETPLQRELARIGKRVAIMAGVAAAIVFAVGLSSGGSVESLFLIAVALAVAAIPEGLPAVTTITLARGVRAMATRNAIVRRLPAVEALGAAQIVCTDKTGTLTKNRMRVARFDFEPGVGDRGDVATRFGRAVALCSDARSSASGWTGDPTEVALIEGVDPMLVNVEQLAAEFPRVDELGFDSDRKRMVTLHRSGERWLLVMKGAPEVVIGMASKIARDHIEDVLDEEGRSRVLERASGLAAAGLRTIAAAEAWFDDQPFDLAIAESGVTLLGVAGIADEVRTEVGAALDTCRQAGIKVVMVTGDHAITARAVAEEVGLLEGRDVVHHTQLVDMSDDQLAAAVESVGAFARVEPADKVRIVKAWQNTGKLVAMTGDGVNDAPALRIADIGVGMGTGTDVAKDASDVVLADDNFATIVAAVELGRSIFANLRRVTYFLLAANLSEIVVMLVGFLLFASYGEPLLAVQLLWVNLVTDGLPALALGVDPPERHVMSRPPDSDRNMLGASHQVRLVWQGAVLALGPLGLFFFGIRSGYDWEVTRTMAFTALVAVQLVHALSVRAQSSSILVTPINNRPLVAALLASFATHVLVVSTPAGAALLGTSPFPSSGWTWIVAAAVAPAVVIDAIKVTSRRLRPTSITARD